MTEQQACILWVAKLSLPILQEVPAGQKFIYAHLQVSTEGDAFTIAFHDPVDAVAWAVTIQQVRLMYKQIANLLI